MAASDKKASEARPLVDLRAEAAENLNKIAADLEEAEKDLNALEKIGLDVSRLRERVEWAKNARTVIMERFMERK